MWANYYRGLACLRLGRPTEAVAAFSACVALAPGVAWCVYNRGLAYAMADQPGPALADFDRAVAIDPSLAAAERAAATDCLRRCLEHAPDHPDATHLLARLTARR